jgi:hypothetical protein
MLVTGGWDQANNTQKQAYISGGYQNVPSTSVIDVEQIEGVSSAQMMAQILLELQILNQQLHQLPLLLNNGIVNDSDEPSRYRQEPSIFNSNLNQ